MMNDRQIVDNIKSSQVNKKRRKKKKKEEKNHKSKEKRLEKRLKKLNNLTPPPTSRPSTHLRPSLRGAPGFHRPLRRRLGHMAFID